MAEFKQGQKINTASGGTLEVIQKLGEGGQGIVYKVKYNGKDLALKWYFGNKLKDPTKFYENIKNNISKGKPSDSFLWPLEITEHFEGSFGYLMELRPSEYKDFSRFLLAKEKIPSIDALINAALTITNGFRSLHQRGYSYQDLNDGNFFINPKTGNVLICDNDNVAPYGESLGVAGKCRYMAPEIVMGKKRPSVHTDRFSLAVILFLLLFLNHPLEGKKTLCPCLTEELERRFYGSEPVFVWDDSGLNAPVRGVHTNTINLWPVYPKFIRDIFKEAFSKSQLVGEDFERRTLEKTWEETFISLRGCLINCPYCGKETFFDVESSQHKCIECGKSLPNYPYIKLQNKYYVVLAPNQKLFDCHVDMISEDYNTCAGEVISSKNDPSALGIRNLSKNNWEGVLPNGQAKTFEPNSVIKIGRGITINFGSNNDCKVM